MYFVLGGSGFLGKAITDQLKALNRPFASISKANYSEFVGQTCDVLINANGNSKKYLAKSDPAEDFELSVASVRRSIDDFTCDKYVYLSSGEVYAKKSGSETSESTRISVSEQSTYGFHKYLAEQLVRHAASNWLILRLGGFVGPELKKNVVFDLLSNQPTWVSLESTFQFLETKFAAEVVLSLCDGPLQNEVFNIAASDSISVADIAKILSVSPTARENAGTESHELDTRKLQKIHRVPSSKESLENFISFVKNERGF